MKEEVGVSPIPPHDEYTISNSERLRRITEHFHLCKGGAKLFETTKTTTSTVLLRECPVAGQIAVLGDVMRAKLPSRTTVLERKVLVRAPRSPSINKVFANPLDVSVSPSQHSKVAPPLEKVLLGA